MFRRPFARILFFTAAALAALSTPARAHHGRDFLLSQTAELPHPGQVFLIARQSFLGADEGDEVELEPAILVGLGERFAFELHAHAVDRKGEDLEYEATAPAVSLLLTKPHRQWGVILSMEYEIAAGGGGEGDHHEEPGILQQHEARGQEEDHHGSDRAEARLAVSGRLGRSELAFDLVAEEVQRAGADVEWGYSAGWRRSLVDGVALGLEAQGELASGAAHEALFGVYWEGSERWTLNGGVGAGFGEGSLDLSVHTAFVWRLR